MTNDKREWRRYWIHPKHNVVLCSEPFGSHSSDYIEVIEINALEGDIKKAFAHSFCYCSRCNEIRQKYGAYDGAQQYRKQIVKPKDSSLSQSTEYKTQIDALIKENSSLHGQLAREKAALKNCT